MGDLEDFQARVTALEFGSPEDVEAWAEEVVLPKREQRLVDQFVAEWRTELSQAFVARLTADAEAIKVQHGKTQAETNDGIRRTIDIKKAVATGRMASAEALREITRLARQREQALGVQAALQRSVDQWVALSDATAEDFAAQRKGRFQNVPRTRRLTGAYLAGQEDGPFRKRGR
jgi:hypothetical protein